MNWLFKRKRALCIFVTTARRVIAIAAQAPIQGASIIIFCLVDFTDTYIVGSLFDQSLPQQRGTPTLGSFSLHEDKVNSARAALPSEPFHWSVGNP